MSSKFFHLAVFGSKITMYKRYLATARPCSKFGGLKKTNIKKAPIYSGEVDKCFITAVNVYCFVCPGIITLVLGTRIFAFCWAAANDIFTISSIAIPKTLCNHDAVSRFGGILHDNEPLACLRATRIIVFASASFFILSAVSLAAAFSSDVNVGPGTIPSFFFSFPFNHPNILPPSLPSMLKRYLRIAFFK